MFIVRTSVYQDALDQIKELRDKLNQLQGEYQLKEQKAVHALEARLERELSQMTTRHNTEISNLKVKHSEAMAKEKSESAERHYGKLSDSMTKLHEQGNATTQFMEKIVVSMTDAYGMKHGVTTTENIKIEHKND